MAKRELKKVNVEETTVETTEVVAPEVVEEKKEERVAKKGVVANCSLLNIRKKPDIKSDVLAIVDSGSKLTIDLDKSNDKWLKVTTKDKIQGYCMKDYVKIN